MSFDLTSIQKGVTDRPPRIILCGVEKIGKSTFASQFPSVLMIPIKGEEGVDAIDVAKTPVVDSWSGLLEIISALIESEHPFQTLVIDSISALEPLIWDAICKAANKPNVEAFGYGKGYIEAVTLWRELAEALDYLRNHRNMGSILIGHVSLKTFNDPTADPYDQYAISLHKAAAELLYRWADVILFAASKVYTKQQGGKGKAALIAERILFTQKRPSHPGGGRGIYGQLPYELDFNYQVYQAAIEAAKKGLK